jgi:transcription antitermination factor NusG
MSDTTMAVPLSQEQKTRLASTMQEALTKRQRLYMAKILGSRESVIDKYTAAMMEAESRFADLLKVRGLCRGDTVRIVVDGPYRNKVAVVNHVEPSSGRVELRLPGVTCLPLATEVVLVKAKT